MTQPPASQTRIQRARQKRAQQAKQRRLQQQRERLRREQVWAQRALRTLEQALQELGLPEPIAAEVQWRQQAQPQLLGKLLAMLCPPDVWVPQRP